MYKYVYNFLLGNEGSNNEVFEGKKGFGNFNTDVNHVLNSSYFNYGDNQDNNSGESR